VIHGFARGRAADWLPAAHGKINKKFGLRGNSKGKYRIAVLFGPEEEIPVGFGSRALLMDRIARSS
jgi:hypothetical protein